MDFLSAWRKRGRLPLAGFICCVIIGLVMSSAYANHHLELIPEIRQWQQQMKTYTFKKISPAALMYANENLFIRSIQSSQTPKPAWTALMETRRVLTAQEIKDLEAKGIQFSKAGKTLLSMGNYYPIRITKLWGWLSLERSSLVKRVESSGITPSIAPPPLDFTSHQIQATHLHRTLHRNLPIRGKGVVVGSIDSGIDIFHPSFFRADGGLYAWLDNNNDGRFTPCVDAVDFNKNGAIDRGEKLCCIQTRIYYYGKNPVDPVPPAGVCRAGRDWLYQDVNGNQKRDFGPSAGFTETSPSFGEQLFIIDDVNKNGVLDIGEKIVALKTSKVKATFIYGVERVRGKDLIHSVVGKTRNNNASHGTGSSSVMISGHPGYSKFTGIAPDAEIVLSTRYAKDASGRLVPAFAEAMGFLKKHGVNAALHEYAVWTRHFLDGSSAHEQLLDKLGKEGMIQICPTGNLGGSMKHMTVEVKAGETVTMPLEVKLPSRYPPNYPSFKRMYLTILSQGNPKAELKFTLITPDKKRMLLKKDNARGEMPVPNVILYSHQDVSSRQTIRMNTTLLGWNGSQRQFVELPKGTWQLEIVGDKLKAAKIHAYVQDQISGWGQGIRFLKNVNNDGLAGWPSTADTAIGVGAYAAHDKPPYRYASEKSGRMRKYSGGGPRIDGQPIVWIAAPDNPVVATSEALRDATVVGLGHYMVYGGTSGASPHVTAAAALMKQIHPEWNQLQVREAIRKGALVDEDVKIDAKTFPHKHWGYGKLRIYKSLFGKEPPQNTPPTIAPKMEQDPPQAGKPWRFYLGRLPKELKVEVSDKEDKPEELLVRWDKGYDGEWEKEKKENTLPFPLDKAGKVQVKVQVQDSQRETKSMIFSIEVLACKQDQECGDDYICAEGSCKIKPKPEPKPEPVAEQSGVPDAGGNTENSGKDAGETIEGPGEDTGCGCSQQQGPYQHSSWILLLSLFALAWKRTRRSVQS